MPILLLLSVLRRNVSRNYVFYNFCFTWILYSIIFCLLLYAGEQSGPKPIWSLCRTQAALVYSAPILVATASCALVFQLWLDVRAPENKVVSRTFFSLRNITLLGLPYTLASGYLIGPMIVAISARQTINRDNALFYCSSNLRALTVTSAASVGIIFLITLTFEVMTARLLSRRAKIQQLNNWWMASGFFLRIALFTAYLVLSVVASGVEIAEPSSPVRIIIQACGPLIVFAVFGSTPALYAFSRPELASSRSSHTSDKSTTAFYQPVTTL